MVDGSVTTVPPLRSKWVIIGFAVFATGLLFKLAHWPTAGFLLILSCVPFAIAPFTGLRESRQFVSWSLFGRLSLACTMLYIVFRLQYWNGAFALFWLSVPIHISALVFWIRERTPSPMWFVPQIGLLLFMVWFSFVHSYCIHATISLSSPFHPEERLVDFKGWYTQSWFLYIGGEAEQALVALDSAQAKFDRVPPDIQAMSPGTAGQIMLAREAISSGTWHEFERLGAYQRSDRSNSD